ncbi:MAG: tetratricopeptide repeat protein [Bacteroidetes bacterium]|nr:tetratricopeptide repeat protein [Bacteroidota bacterium]
MPSLSHEQLGALYYQRGDKQKALEHYREAAHEAPHDPAIQKSLADFCYVEMGQAEEALQAYRQVLDLKADDPEVLQIAGNLCATLKRFEEARGYYTRLLAVQPWNTDVRKALQALPADSVAERRPDAFTDILQDARRSFSSGSQTGLDEAIDRLVEYKRGNTPEAAAPRMRTYDEILDTIRQGNDAAAIDALETFLADTPDHADAHNALGVLCYRTGAVDRSLEHYRKAVALAPGNATFRKNLADYLFVVSRDAEAALEQYVHLLRAQPQDAETLIALAQICVELGRTDDARVFVDSLLSLQPWNQQARELRNALQAVKPPVAARESRESAHSQARMAITAGRTAEAARLLEEQVRSHPADAAARNDLGFVYYQLGRTAEAGLQYAEAARLDPQNETYNKNLADYYVVAEGRIEDALSIYVQLLRRAPRDVDTLIGIGRICELLGRIDDARDFCRKALDVEPWNTAAREILGRLGA